VIFGDYEAKYDATLRGELVNAGTPDAVRAVVKKYICRGWLFPQMKAALDQVKDRMKGNFYNVAVAYATVHLLIQARDDREIAASIKCPQPIRGGIYDNIRCSSRLTDRNGNATACDSHDLTDYDIYGVARGWWNLDTPLYKVACASKPAGCAALQKSNPNGVSVDAAYYQSQKIDPSKTCCMKVVSEPPRLDYCGDLYGSKAGDRDTGLRTKDGRPIFLTGEKEPKFYAMGGDKCRLNPKDWHAEEAREVAFLLTFDQLMKAGKVNEAFGLMTAFFMHKSTVRHQWVTKVPSFVAYANRPHAATNGRYTYLAARFRNIVDGQEVVSYFYLPNDPGLQRIYRSGPGGIYNVVAWGDYGRPGYVVAPPEDGACKNEENAKALLETVKWIASFVEKAFIPISKEDIIGFVVGLAVKQATKSYMEAQGGAAAAMSESVDVLDFSMGMSSLVEQWNDITAICIATAERKIPQPAYRALVAKAVKQFTDPIWAKVEAQKKKTAAPATPPSTPTTGKSGGTPKGTGGTSGGMSSTNWGAAIAGAAAGAVAGGPVGGVVGAVAAAMLTRKK